MTAWLHCSLGHDKADCFGGRVWRNRVAYITAIRKWGTGGNRVDPSGYNSRDLLRPSEPQPLLSTTSQECCCIVSPSED